MLEPFDPRFNHEKLMEQVNAHDLRCSYRYENGTNSAILSGAPEALAVVLAALK